MPRRDESLWTLKQTTQMSIRCRYILATRAKGIRLSLDAQKRKQSEKCNELESNLNARDATTTQDNGSSYLQRHPHEEN